MALLAVAVGCPYAIPVPWLAIMRWATGTVVENPGFLTSPVNNQSWFVVFGAGCVGWAAIVFYRRTDAAPEDVDHSRQRLVFYTGTVWFAIMLVRAFFAPQFQSLYTDLLLQTGFLILFIVATLHRARARELAMLQIMLITVVIPLAVIALMQNAGADPLAYSSVVPGTLEIIKGKQLIASTFGHPNYMGSYFAPSVVMALGLAVSRAHWFWRALGAASATLCMLALVAGGTRGPLLAAAAGVIIFFVMARFPHGLWTKRRSLIVAMCGLAACIAGALALYMLPSLRLSFDISERIFASKEIASRAFYWVVGLEMFKASPVFGIGAGQFDSQFWWALSRMPEIETGGAWHFMVSSIVRGVRPGYMHNDHLQVLVESGLTGALAWASLWTAIIVQGRRFSRRSDSPGRPAACHTYLLNASFVGAFAAVAVDGVFGFPFHLPCSGALFWVALGLWGGWNRMPTFNPDSKCIQNSPNRMETVGASVSISQA